MTVMNQMALRDEERQRCEVWTRVMGYHRPVSEFNAGKQSEHAERRHFVEAPAGHDASMRQEAPCATHVPMATTHG